MKKNKRKSKKGQKEVKQDKKRIEGRRKGEKEVRAYEKRKRRQNKD